MSAPYSLLIGGERRPAASLRTFATIDPASGEAWAQLPDADASDVDAAVAAARAAVEGSAWRELTASRRGELLFALADVLERRGPELAEIETRDNGKILRETRAQMAALPRWFRFFGGLADKVEGTVPHAGFPEVLTYVVGEPLGVVAALVPWNSSLMLSAWKLAPALAAGNAVVVKPSEFTSASLLHAADAFAEAGLPPGVVNVVTGRGAETGQALVAHPGVDYVTFTGGPDTARAIAHQTADHLTPMTLELGGKSAQLVFADADLDAATTGVLAGIFAATGQTCIAGSRLLVHRSVHDELVERLVTRAALIRLGDPREPETQMGPLTTPAQLERTLGFVEDAVAAGARVATGGRRANVSGLPAGLFVEPTILTATTPGMRVVDDEVFGPVLSVMAFESDAEAIALANASQYRLAAGVWSRDIGRAHRAAKQLRAGTVWVNMYRTASPAMPVGGSGHSGYGRESGIQALRAMTQDKSVWVELGSQTPDPFVQRY